MKPVAWIKEQELAYMSAAAGIGETEWKTNLGLEPEPGDVPLYTAPPKKEWVGLTDIEIENLSRLQVSINGMIYKPTVTAIVRAIEARLREKNHG